MTDGTLSHLLRKVACRGLRVVSNWRDAEIERVEEALMRAGEAGDE
jgi:hypothetical protein